MVLQQAPHQANLWGVVPGCGSVTVMFDGRKYAATIIHDGNVILQMMYVCDLRYGQSFCCCILDVILQLKVQSASGM